jgi:hypothetical protein
VSVVCVITYFLNFHSIFSRPLPPVPKRGTEVVNSRDGQHDFDFNFGTWKTHMKRLKHPLTGSAEWVELHGTVAVRKVWDRRAQLEEVEADGPNGHFEDLGLFLYNLEGHNGA